MTVATWWMAVDSRRPDGEHLVLAGSMRMSPGARPTLELRRESDSLTFTYPVSVDHGRTPGRFVARVLLSELQSASPPGDDALWELWATHAGHRVPLSFTDGVPLARTRRGGAALLVSGRQPAIARSASERSGSQVVRT